MNSRRALCLEVAVLTTLFVVALETLLQHVPLIDGLPVTVAGSIRLLIFGCTCIAGGYWLRARNAETNIIILGLALGIAFAFAHRFYRGDAAIPEDLGDAILILALAIGTWLAFLAGVIGKARSGSTRNTAVGPT
jgi:hypothetical protein